LDEDLDELKQRTSTAKKNNFHEVSLTSNDAATLANNVNQNDMGLLLRLMRQFTTNCGWQRVVFFFFKKFDSFEEQEIMDSFGST
jgi:hypothetical protein